MMKLSQMTNQPLATASNNLLLITGNYPFYPAETFLHGELPYLAAKFNKIYILPINGDIKATKTDLQHNVEVLSTISAKISKKPLYSLPHSFRSLSIFKPAIAHEIKKYPSKWINPLLTGRSFWRINRATQVIDNLTKFVIEHDIKITYSYWLSVGALIGWYLQEKVPGQLVTVSRVHGYDLYHEANLFHYCPFQSFLVNQLSWIVCISNQGAQYLKKYDPDVADKIQVFKLGSERGKKGRPSKDNTLRIVSCSNLIPIKRIHLIAEALKFVRTNIEWTHFGEGPEKAKIEKIVSYQLPSNIKANFPGYTKNKEILEYYSQMPVDLFLNVSSSEGIPVSMMECMSRGIPVMGTSVGGVKEIVSPELHSGILIEKEITPHNLAFYIDSFAELSEAERQVFRDGAYKTWESLYNSEKNYSDFARWLHSISPTGV